MLKTNVIAYFRTQAACARFLDITRDAVSKWGDVIPEGAALKLEKRTDGALKYDESLYAKPADPPQLQQHG